MMPSSGSPSHGTGSDDTDAEDMLVGRPVELRPEVCDVFEAMMYCTSVSYSVQVRR